MKRWLRRRRNTYGFGVQSPNDFYFVQHVLREEAHYYAYATLHRLARQAQAYPPSFPEPLYRLLFRLTNHAHPEVIVEIGCGFSVFAMVLARQASRCIGITASDLRHTAMLPLLSDHPRVEVKKGDEMALFSQILRETQTIGILHIAHTDHYREAVEAALPYTNSHSVIAISGIRDSKEKQAWWSELQKSPLTGVSYDLGDMGLLFFDKARYKDTYWINLKH